MNSRDMNSRRKLDRSYSGEEESFQSIQYKKYSNSDYDLFLQPFTIEKYLSQIIRIQNVKEEEFFPNEESNIRIYFDKISKNFNHNKIKYSNESNLKVVRNILVNNGRSGSVFIKSMEQLDYINRPVLLFYGIEHLSAFFLNMHYNFTQENSSLSPIMSNKYYSHGIDSHQFNRIDINEDLTNLLNYKIRLTKQGFASRFFLSLGFPLDKYFLQQREICLIDLIRNFFLNSSIGISNKTMFLVRDDLSSFFQSSSRLDYDEDNDLFIFYMLSFIFCHLSRYKMYTWQRLITFNEFNIGFYLKYIIDKIRELFKRKIFSIIHYYNDIIARYLRNLDKESI